MDRYGSARSTTISAFFRIAATRGTPACRFSAKTAGGAGGRRSIKASRDRGAHGYPGQGPASLRGAAGDEAISSEGAQRPEIASPRNDRQGRPSEGRNDRVCRSTF